MIQGFLRGKIPELEGKEDALTSAVFGRLRYLNPGSVLIPFLSQAIDCEKGYNLYDFLKASSINLNEYTEANLVFWPKAAELGEPDLIILFSSKRSDVTDLLIIVEVKYKSPKSGAGENDQLRRYFEAVTHHLKRFNNAEISRFKGHIGPLVYLTEYDASDEIRASRKELCKRFGDCSYPLFNLRWSSLHKTLQEARDRNDNGEKVIEDLLTLLSCLHLQNFNGISSPSGRIIDVVSWRNPVFFCDSQTIKEVPNYFTSLPVVTLGKNEYCFFKRGKSI